MMNLDFIERFYEKYSIPVATQAILSVAFILIIAFLMTRITKKLRLPNVTAYILSGILIGPYVFNLIPQNIISGMSFIQDMGLGFIAFASGRYFNLNIIRRNGFRPLILGLFQALATSAAVFLVMLAFGFSVPIALVIGSIGGTTSSASTLMTIREYRCEGEFVDYSIEVNSIDNLFGILSFSVCLGVALATLSSGKSFSAFKVVWLPILVNLGLMVLGGLLAFLMGKVINKPTRTHDNRLILTVFCILALVGVCGLSRLFSPDLAVTPLLSVMVFAMVYVNLTNDESIFDQVADFSAPITLIFFCLSGMKFQISYLGSVGLAGVVYFFVRLLMKYGSSYVGGVISKSPKTVRDWIGFTMEPQAGISLGLAAILLSSFTALSAEKGDGSLAEVGAQINAIIVFAGILYEIVGPALAKLALKKSGVLSEEKRISASGNGPFLVRSESMLHDAVVIEEDPALLKKRAELSELKKNLDEANLYIHTKDYTDASSEGSFKGNVPPSFPKFTNKK